jgi:hypothetical protein
VKHNPTVNLTCAKSHAGWLWIKGDGFIFCKDSAISNQIRPVKPVNSHDVSPIKHREDRSLKKLLLLVCIMLFGCVNNSALLVGPKGKVLRCASSGWGYIGVPVAYMSFSKCKEDAATMGYLPIEDAGFIGIVLNEQQINGEYVIARVKDGSPAANANIKPGDVIVAVQGQKPAGIDDLYNLTFGKKNEPVEISFMHEGQMKTVTLIRTPREIHTAPKD